jgi:hypothetical protein
MNNNSEKPKKVIKIGYYTLIVNIYLILIY